MKLEKLLCLKCLRNRVAANKLASQTMKLFRARLHDSTESVAGSSTISNVLVRNGGGPVSFSPGISTGASCSAAAAATASSSLTKATAASMGRSARAKWGGGDVGGDPAFWGVAIQVGVWVWWHVGAWAPLVDKWVSGLVGWELGGGVFVYK